MKEIRCYQRIEEVNKMYYVDEKEARECYTAGQELLSYIKDNNIELDIQVMFKFTGNVIQMAIECGEIEEADRLIMVAGDHVTTDWNFVGLSWRESSVKFKKGEKEISYNLYKMTLGEYIRLHKEFPDFQPEITKNNIYAIKKEIGCQFDDEEYIMLAMKDAISLYSDKIISPTEFGDTYQSFKRVNQSLTNAGKIKDLLKRNKITL